MVGWTLLKEIAIDRTVGKSFAGINTRIRIRKAIIAVKANIATRRL